MDLSLIISSRRAEALERVRQECKTGAGRIEILPVDLSDPHEVEEASGKAMKLFGRIDILINNGGISQRSLASSQFISPH